MPTESERTPAEVKASSRPLPPSSGEIIRARLADKNLPLASNRITFSTAKTDTPLPPTPSSKVLKLRRIAGFTVLRLLGEGGMGAVYLGYSENLDKQVAIKVLPEELASNANYVARFDREARNSLYLNHPHIVRGLAVGVDNATGQHFLIMEYVDGPSAHRLLDRLGRLQIPDAVHILRDVALALEYAHGQSVIHRDIKPDNIIITPSGLAKLADLGLAKRIDDQAGDLTSAQQGFGTPHYMSLEQTRNAKLADMRSDLFALGATAYHLLTGKVPFPGDTAMQIAERKAQGDYTPAHVLNPEVPAKLEFILSKLLAREPNARFQTASELLVAIERSKLAAAVPSFVDPELALRDPEIRARVMNPPEPTRIDLGDACEGESSMEDSWYVQTSPAVKPIRATTAELVQRLASRELLGKVRAARCIQGPYFPLESYPEFAPRSPTVATDLNAGWWKRLWRLCIGLA